MTLKTLYLWGNCIVRFIYFIVINKFIGDAEEERETSSKFHLHIFTLDFHVHVWGYACSIYYNFKHT